MERSQASMYKKGGSFHEGWGFSDMIKLLVKGTSIDRNKMFGELKTTYPDNQVEKEGDDTVAIYVPDSQISNVKKMAKLFNMKVAYAEGGEVDSEKHAWGGLFGDSKKPEHNMAFYLHILTDRGTTIQYVSGDSITEAKERAVSMLPAELRKTAKVDYWKNITNEWKKGRSSKVYAEGGQIGDSIVFRRYSDDDNVSGTITDIFPEGAYEVTSGFTKSLVEQNEIVSINKPTSSARKKLFGIFADGGRTDTRVAEIILSQIGGMGRVKMMTGGYNFVALKNGVSFRIKNRGANFIKITLNSRDLYDVEIGRIFNYKYKIVKTFDDVYFDQLYEVLYEGTGMYFKLFAKGGTIQNEERDMILNQLKQVNHHEEELRQIMENNLDIEPWVIAKMERATTTLSDVTHYLDGKTEKYAEGGMFHEVEEMKFYIKEILETPNGFLTVIVAWGKKVSNKITIFVNNNDSDDSQTITFSDLDEARATIVRPVYEEVKKVVREAEEFGFKSPMSNSDKQYEAMKANPEYRKNALLLSAMKAFSDKSATTEELFQIFKRVVGEDVTNVSKMIQMATEYRNYLIKWDLYDDYLDFVSDNYPKDSGISRFKAGGRTKKPLTAKEKAMSDIRKEYIKINVPYLNEWYYPSEQWNRHALKNDTEFWLDSEEEMPYISHATMGMYADGGKFKSTQKYHPDLFKIPAETLAKKHWIVKVIVGTEKAKFFFEQMSEVDEFVDNIKHLADEVYVSKERHYAEGGKIGFTTLSKKVAQRYINQLVKPKYQAEYGKTYDEKEAEEVGQKVAGKVYWKQKRSK